MTSSGCYSVAKGTSSPSLVTLFTEMVDLFGRVLLTDLSKTFLKLAGSVVLRSTFQNTLDPQSPCLSRHKASSFLTSTHSTLQPFFFSLLKLSPLYPLWTAEQSLNQAFQRSLSRNAIYFSSVHCLYTAVQAISHFASSLYKNEWIQGANWWLPGQAGGIEGWDEIGEGD